MLSKSAHKFPFLLVSFSLAAVVVSASSASADSSAVVSVSASVSSASNSAVVSASVASRQQATSHQAQKQADRKCFFMLSKLLFFQISHKTQKALEVFIPRLLIGDPYGNRTHDSAVKGRCLNRLTNGPKKSQKKTCKQDVLLVTRTGIEPMIPP